MGKKQLGELQPSELVCPLIPHLKPCVPVHRIAGCPPRHQHADSVSYCCLRNTGLCPVRKVPPGAASRIRAAAHCDARGRDRSKRLKELRFTPDDLLEALRAKDIFELSDVALAIWRRTAASACSAHEADSTANGALGLKPPKQSCPAFPSLLMETGRTIHLNFWALRGNGR